MFGYFVFENEMFATPWGETHERAAGARALGDDDLGAPGHEHGETAEQGETEQAADTSPRSRWHYGAAQ